jgi:predicted aspartyl protease
LPHFAGLKSGGPGHPILRDLAPFVSCAAALPAPVDKASIQIEILDGLVLFPARLTGTNGRDTLGVLVLDTGAGRLALDRGIARFLGVDSTSADSGVINLGTGPLARMSIGAFQLDHVTPVLVIDAAAVTRVTDRTVLGLIGERAMIGYAVELDYAQSLMTLIPVPMNSESKVLSPIQRADLSKAALGSKIRSGSIPVALERAGDGKLIATAQLSDPRPPRTGRPMRLILDTGATKTAFFEPRLRLQNRRSSEWRSLTGLTAPTLLGPAEARMVRIPVFEVSAARGISARAQDVDAAVIDGPLGDALSREVGFAVDGLLGHSFLRRFHVVIDPVHLTLWLAPVGHGYDVREYEYTHIGIQIERIGGELRVTGVCTESPAQVAGIERGDELIAINGMDVEKINVVDVTRMLEGPEDSAVEIVIRRAGTDRRISLLRAKLL